MHVELGVAISKIAVARNLRRAVLAVERCEVGRIASASRASYGLDTLLDCLAIVCCGAAFLSAEDARSFNSLTVRGGVEAPRCGHINMTLIIVH